MAILVIHLFYKNHDAYSIYLFIFSVVYYKLKIRKSYFFFEVLCGANHQLNVKYWMKYINMSENNEAEVLAKTAASPDQTMRYVSYVVMVLVLCALIFFAYKKFNANKSDNTVDDDDCGESGKRGKKDGGGIAAGYDVHAAVGEIEAMQARVMNKVSTNVTV